MTDLEQAIQALGGHTLALCKDGDIITSDKRGVAPMVGFIRDGKDLHGYSAADKVVGKAAAMLFIKAGITALHAVALSKSAETLLKSHGVKVSCDTLTEYIINRDKTGMCPMEQTVLDTDDIETGTKLIMQRLDEMMSGKAK